MRANDAPHYCCPTEVSLAARRGERRRALPRSELVRPHSALQRLCNCITASHQATAPEETGRGSALRPAARVGLCMRWPWSARLRSLHRHTSLSRPQQPLGQPPFEVGLSPRHELDSLCVLTACTNPLPYIAQPTRCSQTSEGVKTSRTRTHRRNSFLPPSDRYQKVGLRVLLAGGYRDN